MSGPSSFRLSRETRDLLRQNQDFFSSVLSLFDGKGEDRQKTPLKFKPADAEARTEAEVKANGDVEVTLVIPLDDNENAADGRVYLKDKFLFDPTQKVLKDYKRSFELGGNGDAAAWKGWLGKYEALLKDSPKLNDAMVQRFGLAVARTYGQPVVDEKEQTLSHLSQAFKREHRYLDSLNGLVRDQGKGLGLEDVRLRIKDKESHYQVIRKGDQLELIFNLAIDADGKAENGRIWLRDHFFLSAGKMTSFSREWLADPKAAESTSYGLLESLKRQPDPDQAETKAFAENLYPDVVPQQNPNPNDVMAMMAASVQGPKSESAFKGRGRGGPEVLAAQKEVLGILEVLAKEDVAKRADHAAGLLNFSSKVDVNAEQGNLESLFTKLKAAQETGRGATLKSLLEGLDLSEAEQGQRQKVLGLAAFSELNSLAQEKDNDLRHEGLLHLADSRLFGEQAYPGTALTIAEGLQEDPQLKAKAGKLLDLAQGKGSFGSKVEFTFGHFHKEMTKPSMLVGMMAAPFAGAAFEAGSLRFAKYLYDAKKIQNVGTGIKLASSGAGMFGESLAFTGMHRGYERLWHGSDTAWKDADKEILSSMLLFTGMRATHAGGSWASSRMAEGKFNFSVKGREVRFGGRDGTAAYSPNFAQPTPTGRLMMGNPWVPTAGIGAPTLSKLGQASAGTMNHLGGIFAMQGSGWASRQLGLAPDNGQGFGANFFDATVMYGQAMLGFSLANKASMGKLQPALGEVKMRIHGFDAKAGYTPIVPEKPAAKAGKPFEFGSLFQKILPKRASATSQPPKPTSSQGKPFGSRVREGLGSAREWLSKLGPSKVKELEAKLAAAEIGKTEALAEVETKGQEIAALEAQVTQISGERNVAQGEASTHKADAEAKATRITEVEGALGREKADVADKAHQIEVAKAELQRVKAAKEAAEGKLGKIEENAEAAELGLDFTDPKAETQALRDKIQLLSLEKNEAEIRAATFDAEVQELRGKVEVAGRELKRREGVDVKLSQAERELGELQTSRTDLQEKLESLRSELIRVNHENLAASRLTGTLAERVSDLEQTGEKLQSALEAKTQEVATQTEKVAATAREAQILADKLGESDAELGTARRQLESEKSRTRTLEESKAALELAKAEIQQKLDAKVGDNAQLTAQLAEKESALTEVGRELKTANGKIETAERLKTAKEAENARLRSRIVEVQDTQTESEGRLNVSIRGLQEQIKAQELQIAEATTAIEGLRQDLGREVSRAEGAEGREAELQAKHEALDTQHQKTLSDLANAERLLKIANSQIEGKDGQLRRETESKAELVKRLEALRRSKGEVDTELTTAKADKKRLEERLKESERLLEVERTKEPEIDVSAEVELQEKIDAFEREQAALEGRILGLERNKTELQDKVQELEGQKTEAERKVRSTETEVEMAKGAADSLRDDLRDLQERSNNEARDLRDTLENWRKRATTAETEKAQTEARNTSLDGELGRARGRIESLETEFKSQGEELLAERGKNQRLTQKVGELNSANEGLRSQLEGKESEMTVARAEAEDKIGSLTREKEAQETQLQEKQGIVERLRREVSDAQTNLTEASRKTREAKDEARRDHSSIEEAKRLVERELATKVRALTSAETSVTEKTVRIEELEGQITEARTAAEAEQTRFKGEKAALEGKLEAQDQTLAQTRRELAESVAKTQELEGQLVSARASLESEKLALGKLRTEHETLAARSAGELERLRGEVSLAEQVRTDAETRAREEGERASTLESAIVEVRATAEREAQEAAGKIEGADQRAARAEAKSGENLRQLEVIKATSAREAEQLRNEAATAATQEGLAKERVTELERTTAASAQRIATLEAELRAARAQVEALEAPASLREAAESTAQRLRGELAAEKEKLIAAEARATASSEKVKALEGQLAAQRATYSQEAIRHQAEAEAHETKSRAAGARATAAESRATAAEERITAAEAKAEAEKNRAEAAELRAGEAETKARAAEIQARGAKAAADASSGTNNTVLQQRDRRITGLEADLTAAKAENIAQAREATEYETSTKAKITALETKAQGLESRAQEAEARAVAAEARAETAEAEGRDYSSQAEQMATSLREAKAAESSAKEQLAVLLRQKSGTEHQITQLTETINSLETMNLEHISKRRELDTELTASKKKIGEIEAKLRGKEAEVTRLTAQIQEVWRQGQSVGQGSIEQKTGYETKIVELTEQITILTEDLRVARDAERTVELLAEKEKLQDQDLIRLKGELKRSQRKLDELQREIDTGTAANPELALAAENLRSVGVNEGFFHQVDPRAAKINAKAQGSVLLRNAAGLAVGEAKIITGGAEGDMALKYADGSRVTSRTSRAGRQYQQDGSLIGRFTLPNGTEVKLIAGADGAGGHKHGEMASGAFLQGVHALFAEAANTGRIPTAGELFEHGELALAKQKESLDPNRDKGKDPTGAATVVVIVGDEATVASKGDSNLLWGRASETGDFEILGYTETDAIGMGRKYNNLTRGLGAGQPENSEPHTYAIRGLKAGDRLLIGSDGFHGALIGPEFAEQTSPELRMALHFPEANQDTFATVRRGFKISRGQEWQAQNWHDLAAAHMADPKSEKAFFGQKIEASPGVSPDNVFVVDFEQSQVSPNATSIIPKSYVEMPKPLSMAEARERAARPTEPKLPPPVPSRRKADVEAGLFKTYLNPLSELYGTVTEQGSVKLSPSAIEAAREFAELYLRFPELEAQINPELLNRATDRQTQLKIFDSAQKFLEDVQKAEPAKSLAAQDILKKVQGLRKIYDKSSPEEQAIVKSHYGLVLQRMFGSRAEEATIQFADLFKSAPSSVAVYNPNSLVSPEAFRRAYHFNELNLKVRDSGKPFQKATPNEVAQVQSKYGEELQKVFGQETPVAAQAFADLFKTDPTVEASYNPKTLNSPKFFNKLLQAYHPDRGRLTDEVSTDGPGKSGSSIKALFESPAVIAERKSRGWLSPESLVTSFREWTLEPKQESEKEKVYTGGRLNSDISLEDTSVSSRHFTIRSQGKGWVLEEAGGRNGTFVNGKVLANGRGHFLEAGDRLHFGPVELEWKVDAEGRGILRDVTPVSGYPQGPTSSSPPPAEPPPSPVQGAPRGPFAHPPQPATATGGSTFTIPKGQPFIIGNQQINDFGLAQEHVLIQWLNNHWIIQDRGSLYGSQLNGSDIHALVNPKGGRPTGKQFPLKAGDEVRLGPNLLFRFDVQSNGMGQLVHIAGSIIPPSTRHFRPSPGFMRIQLRPDQPQPLMDATRSQQLGIIEWDASNGAYRLRNLAPTSQIWLRHNGQYYVLNEAVPLTNGLIFGLGPNSREAQLFAYQDGIITAVERPGAANGDPYAGGIQPPMHMEFLASENPEGLRLGREHFRHHNSVSGEHLEFRFHESAWWVRDTGSTNGTTLIKNGAAEGTWIARGAANVPIRQRPVGEWAQIVPGNILNIGAFNLRFNSEGGRFSLDEIPQANSEPPYSGPLSADLPSSYRPSPTSGSRQPSVNLQEIKTSGRVPVSLGDSRSILVTSKRGDPGLFYSDPDQPLSGDYYVNLGPTSKLQIMAADLFRLERLDGERYRIINIGAKNGLRIQNDRGKDITVKVGGNDLVMPGDRLVHDKVSFAILP